MHLKAGHLVRLLLLLSQVQVVGLVLLVLASSLPQGQTLAVALASYSISTLKDHARHHGRHTHLVGGVRRREYYLVAAMVHHDHGFDLWWTALRLFAMDSVRAVSETETMASEDREILDLGLW